MESLYCLEEKIIVKPIKELLFTTIEEGNISCVRMEDHIKVVEELEKLKASFEYVCEETRDLRRICNNRGKEIESFKTNY